MRVPVINPVRVDGLNKDNARKALQRSDGHKVRAFKP